MQASANHPSPARSRSTGSAAGSASAAFRDAHASRLYGFALLLTLGDRARAARLSANALASGEARASQLSQPERAAAWLRRNVVDAARGAGRMPQGGLGARRLALEDLGADASTFDGLVALDLRGRAALIAASVECLDRDDVATIVRLSGARLDRCVRGARTRFTAAAVAAAAPGHAPGEDGPIVERIRAITARALG